MKNVLVLNQKGGVGKTTVCEEMVASLMRTETPFCFYNLDPQGGCCYEQHEDDNAEVVVVDTPGVFSDQTVEWVRNADVLVVPVKASGKDLPVFRRMIDLIFANKKKDAKVIVVINQWTRYRASRDFYEWLLDYGKDFIVTKLPQSELFQQASSCGVALTEYAPKSNVAKGVMIAVNLIRQVADLDEEQFGE